MLGLHQCKGSLGTQCQWLLILLRALYEMLGAQHSKGNLMWKVQTSGLQVESHNANVKEF